MASFIYKNKGVSLEKEAPVWYNMYIIQTELYHKHE